MKYYISLLFLSISLISFPKNIKKDETTYMIKKEKIFLIEIGETAALNLAENTKKADIKKESEGLVKEMITAQKDQKAQKKAKRALRKAKKAQKKAERALKKKAKRHRNYRKAQSNLSKSQKRYDNLKRSGDLSPKDEIKWQKRLKKLSGRVSKAQRKL